MMPTRVIAEGYPGAGWRTILAVASDLEKTDSGAYQPTPEEQAAIQLGLEQAERGELVPLEEAMQAVRERRDAWMKSRRGA